jgi:hypothetical protein
MYVRARRTTQMMSIALRIPLPHATPSHDISPLSNVDVWKHEMFTLKLKIRKFGHVPALPSLQKQLISPFLARSRLIIIITHFYVLNVNRHDVLRITKLLRVKQMKLFLYFFSPT